ncbi:MAG: cyclic nucleotide-binding domain protein [Rhizobium sp.]|nr:cyclic nucleotide-binding domain protein [Rhizobium sp.]
MAVDRKFIYDNPWLRTLPPEIVDTLSAKAVMRRLINDELWVSRTEHAAGIAIIVEGGLRSVTFTSDGKEYVFSIMKKGDIWGLVSTIDGINNANDVYAHGTTTILTIDRHTTLACMDEHAVFARCLMDIFCHRLRMANRVLEDRALQPMDVRLARLLLSLRGGDSNDGEHDLVVTQDMLARILGCTRPTVNKQLQQLERDNLIVITYGRIRLTDISKITRLSGHGDYLYF